MDKRINRIESIIFCVVTILTLLPVLSFHFFPTLDGPAHLYNSNLITSLLFDNNKTLHDFLIFNSIPVPNWTGHVILSFFNFFLPAYIAEKILLVFYVVGLAYIFRAIISWLAPENIFFSYLIFPFIYSYFLFLGFYNFLLAIVFMLLAVRYWIINENKNFTLSKGFVLFSFLMLTYFSHLFMFLLFIFFAGILIFLSGLFSLFENPTDKNKIIFSSLKKILILLTVSIIPLALTLHYFYILPSNDSKFFLSHDELMASLKNIRPIIAVNFSLEESYTKKIWYVIAGLLLISFFNKINNLKLEGSTTKQKLTTALKSFVNLNDVWLWFSIVVLFLYFTLADSDGAYGYVSYRLGLVFFISLIMWISLQQLPKWVMVCSVVIVLYCHIKRNQYYFSVAKVLSETAVGYNQIASEIKENAVVMPLNYSDNWLHSHFSNYLGIDKPMVLLENYECGVGYFPLKWNAEKMPTSNFGNCNIDSSRCFNWKWSSWIKNPPRKIDYVFVMGNMDTHTDSCTNNAKRILEDYYKVVRTSNNCKLFELRKQ